MLEGVMRRVLTFLIIVALLAVGAAVLWQLLGRPAPGKPLVQSVDNLVHPPAAIPPPRPPQDYLVLQDQGGIPKTEALRGGLETSAYAYLTALKPVQISDGVVVAEGAGVHTKRYDMCYQFTSRRPAEQYLEFNLSGKWAALDFGFGFSDTEPSEAKGEKAMVLEVQLDGKVVYTSPELRPTDKPVFTTLNITGASRLLFTARRIGYDNVFAPLLLDPFVKAAPAGSS
jgi:hypothetical protein